MLRCKGYARCFFSLAGLLRSKLRQAGYGEETAFVPQACITARKTMKTGWRGPNKTHQLTNSPTRKTYNLTNSQNLQSHHLTKLTTSPPHKTYFWIDMCPLRVAGLPGSGPHTAIACFQGFLSFGFRSVLKIRSRRIGPTPTFSCHGRAQASLALLIWLIEKVLPAIGTQNVS